MIVYTGGACVKYLASCSCVVAHVVVHVTTTQEYYPLACRAVIDAVPAAVKVSRVVAGAGLV